MNPPMIQPVRGFSAYHTRMRPERPGFIQIKRTPRSADAVAYIVSYNPLLLCTLGLYDTIYCIGLINCKVFASNYYTVAFYSQ